LAIGDLNASGSVNNADIQSLLNLLLSGGGSGSDDSAAAVPEPASVVTLCMGMPAIFSCRPIHAHQSTAKQKNLIVLFQQAPPLLTRASILKIPYVCRHRLDVPQTQPGVLKKSVTEIVNFGDQAGRVCLRDQQTASQ
jgi:sensor domain CHASE-containing protein